MGVFHALIRPWFDDYGTTLDDLRSFEVMRAMLVREVESEAGLLTVLKEHRVEDLIAESQADLTAMKDYLDRLDRRILQLQEKANARDGREAEPQDPVGSA